MGQRKVLVVHNFSVLSWGVVPSSSEDVTRALRECFPGGFGYVLFRLKENKNFRNFGDVFFDI